MFTVSKHSCVSKVEHIVFYKLSNLLDGVEWIKCILIRKKNISLKF